MDAAEEERLEAALQVVQAIMQHEVSALLFNVPVDPVKLGIPDYLKVIKQPMVRMPPASSPPDGSCTLALPMDLTGWVAAVKVRIHQWVAAAQP